MSEHLISLEQRAAQLELSPTEWKQQLETVAQFLMQFLKRDLNDTLFIPETEAPKDSDVDTFESSHDLETVLRLLQTEVNEKGLNAASPMHFGYIPGGGQLYAGLADLISCTLNKYVGIYEVAPGGVKIENDLIRWHAQLVGYDPEKAGGHISSGGSLANLTAVVAARDDKLSIRDFEKAVVYVSYDTHHCVQKALRIAGLIANAPGAPGNIHYIPLDDQFRLDPKALKSAIANDKAAGKIPWMVVGSAGTTNVGAIDELQALAEICESENLWFHVDAAYGGYFALLPECREKFQGIARADSVSLDGHKSFFLPYGLGTIILKDKQKLLQSFFYDADYIQDSRALLSPANTSPELTKPFRSLRMWLPMKILGIQPFKDNLREKLMLTQYALDRLKEQSKIELLNTPDLSVIAFRYIPDLFSKQLEGQTMGLDAFTQELLKNIVNAGKAFISGTWLKGRPHHPPVFVLRLAILVFRSHQKHVDLAIDEIIRQAELLESKRMALESGH
ncbi:MAG: aminotransferase class V-fold PLP-dependent enzyme [Bacteroidota bacterium]